MEKNLELQEMTVEEMKTFIKLGKKKEEMFQALRKRERDERNFKCGI